MLAVVGFAAAWLPGRLDPGGATAAPEGLLVPAALGLALAIGLGAAAFVDELRTLHFGWRQFAALAAGFGLALPFLGFAVDALQGRWGLPGEDWATRFAWMAEEEANGEFRVLWLGDAAILPTDAKVVDDVGFGLTRDGTGDARALFAPPEGDAERVLADAIAQTRDQRTIRFGHLVAPIGVRYIAVLDRAAPAGGARGRRHAALDAGLASQLDLMVSRIEDGATVYENEAWIPARAMVPEDVEIPAGNVDPLTAAARTSLTGVTPVEGPQSGSDDTGPGTFLWAEAADAGWRASVDGERLDRSDAFGWTNAFDQPARGSIDLSFDGGMRRVLVWLQLVVWIAVVVAWFRTRRSRRAGDAT
jgi:hypothetical protein